MLYKRFISLIVLLLPLWACGEDSKNEADASLPDASVDTSVDASPSPDASLDAGRPTSITFDVSSDFIVIRDGDGKHVAFPDVVRLPSGGLLVSYREADIHGVDTTGRIMMQTGSADGLTWDAPEVLVDTPDTDDRDLSLKVLSTGEIIASFFQYVIEPTADGNLSVHQAFVGLSTDGGATFGSFAMVGDGAMTYPGAGIDTNSLLWVDGDDEPIIVQACSSPVVEVGGRLLLPFYGGYSWNQANSSAPRSIIGTHVSTDGTTWVQETIAPGQASDIWLQEPALLALDEDRFIVHLRTAEGSSPGYAGNLWQTRSFDGGETWEEYADLGFVGHAPYLHRLPNGVILSAVRELNNAMSRAAVSFIYSLDDGATWSEPVRVVNLQAIEMGYPSIVDLDGDRFLIVFYYGGDLIEAAVVSYVAL